MIENLWLPREVKVKVKVKQKDPINRLLEGSMIVKIMIITTY